MKFTSALAIYALFWSLSFFFVLPFRPSSRQGADALIPGQDRGAPPRFSFAKACLWTTIVAALLFALYYANYVNGWIAPEALDMFSPAERR